MHTPNKTRSSMFLEALFIITKRLEIRTQMELTSRRMDKKNVVQSHNKEETTTKHGRDES